MECSGYSYLSIAFEITAVLEKDKYTTIEIDVPTHIFTPVAAPQAATSSGTPDYVQVTVDVAEDGQHTLACKTIDTGFRCATA